MLRRGKGIAMIRFEQISLPLTEDICRGLDNAPLATRNLSLIANIVALNLLGQGLNSFTRYPIRSHLPVGEPGAMVDRRPQARYRPWPTIIPIFFSVLHVIPDGYNVSPFAFLLAFARISRRKVVFFLRSPHTLVRIDRVYARAADCVKPLLIGHVAGKPWSPQVFARCECISELVVSLLLLLLFNKL